jgi:hypothetical protein
MQQHPGIRQHFGQLDSSRRARLAAGVPPTEKTNGATAKETMQAIRIACVADAIAPLFFRIVPKVFIVPPRLADVRYF